MTEILGVHVDVAQVLSSGGFLVLAWVVVRGFLSGAIRTRREVEEVRQDRDARLEDARVWQRAWEQEAATNRELLELIERSTTSQEQTARVVAAIPAAIGADDA